MCERREMWMRGPEEPEMDAAVGEGGHEEFMGHGRKAKTRRESGEREGEATRAFRANGLAAPGS